MKNETSAGKKLRFAGPVQRFFAVVLLAVFVWLIWAAYSHRYDSEINRFAAWLHQHYEALRRLF